MIKTITIGAKANSVVKTTQLMVLSGDKILLVDATTGQPPKHVSTKMVGKDLHIFADGATDASAVLIDYTDYSSTVEIQGVGQNGSYYNYAMSNSGGMELSSTPAVLPVAENHGSFMSSSAWWGVGILAVAGGVAAAAGGGGGGGSSSSSTTTTTTTTSGTQTGVVIDSLVSGISYTTSSGITGVTGDAGSVGSFHYNTGDTITLKIGAATLATNMAIPSDGVIYPQDMAGVSRTNTTDSAAINIAQFLQSLDDNSNPADGINITQATRDAITTSVTVQTASDLVLQAALPSGVTLVSEATATTQLQTIVNDTTAPSVGIVLTDTVLNSGETTDVTITFTEAVTGFTLADIVAQNGTVSNLTTADNITWTATFTPTASVTDTSNIITIAAGSYSDVAGNLGVFGKSANYTVDTYVAPPSPVGLTITDNTDGTANGSVVYTFTFDSAVTGFTTSDITVTGGTKGTLSGSGTVYTLTVTPPAGSTGNISVNVDAGVAVDSSGAQNIAVVAATQAYDLAVPSALVMSLASDTGINASDNITSSKVINISGVESGATWEYSLDSGGTWTVGSGTSFNLANNTIYGINMIQLRQTDAAGNVSVVTKNTDAITIDVNPPILTITDNEPTAISNMDGSNSDGTTDLDGGNITYTFKFTDSTGAAEAVTGFGISDITITNGTAKTFTQVSQSEYTLEVIPNRIEGILSVNVPSTAYFDIAGNSASASSMTDSTPQAVDMIAPVLMDTLYDDTNGDGVINASDTNWVYDYVNKTISFKLDSQLEAVNMSNPGGFDVYINTHLIDVEAVSMLGDTVTLIMPKAAADSWIDIESVRVVYKDVTTDLTPAIQDLAGNDATSFTYLKPDDTAPTVKSIFFDDSALSIGESSPVTITFSEEVRDAIVSFENGTLTGLAATADARVWTATFTAGANVEYTSNTFSVVDCHDLNGLAGQIVAPATSLYDYTYDVDTRAPSIAISDDEPAAVANIAGTSVKYTFTFSEPVTGFTLQDITIVGGVPAGVLTTVSASVYTLDITPTAGVAGNMTVDVAASAVTDLFGNSSTVALQSIQAVDMKAPTVVISMNDAVVTAGDAPIVTFTFSEAVLGFDGSDLNLSNANGTINNLFSGDGGVTYTGTFAPAAGIAADVVNAITLTNLSYTDVAGNAGAGGSTGNYIVETKAPLISAPITDVVGHTSTGTIEITFNSSLDEGTYAPNSMFFVTDGTLTPDLTDGNALLKFAATAVSVLGNKVTLSIDPSITDTPSATWILTYTDNPGNDAQALQSIYGSDVSSFTYSIATVL
ncbi:MAG: Ig-like domain-containing protein [Sulfuricurvum sp.]|uniref:Ig-like domain-containing protein n=1 Tax=Sulfuricurvum sp. TaxID=2025608 RepID=UPI002626336F|nr:Ig-like domain-containing protein [Sulfuricurvum sp.]MDD2828752.1 Ig-like domain-containing protein [Sulfuricurvum sp.]MDD4949330.1 Ig-like domain-containing protein [Sulfuricurvum sp.]